MKFRSGLLVGLGAGYVLGAKAGRERYQQIVEATRAFMENPGVQRFTDEVGKTVNVGKERVSTATSRKVEQVGSTLADQANKAKSVVAGESKPEESKAKASTPPAKDADGEEKTSAGAPPATATRSGRPT